jgi:hypothetical protein
MITIAFKLESAYGRTRAYPVSQEAKLLCQLTQSKTLLPGAIETIAGLGYRCVDGDGFCIEPSQLY